MKSIVGIYDTNEKAVAAIKNLMASGFPMKEVSMIGASESGDENLKTEEGKKIAVEMAPAEIGVALGTVAGILTGVGVFAIPGLGLLYGAGALIGAIAGFDAGLITGGLISVLSIIGVENDKSGNYEKYIKDGKSLVVVQGDENDIDRAKNILHVHGTHTELNIH
jgi:hypothetical protein